MYGIFHSLRRIRRSGSGPLLASVLLVPACDGPVAQTLCEEVRLLEASLVEEFNLAVARQNLTSEDLAEMLLIEMPVELELVLDDPNRFTITDDHPLRSVIPGTVRDGRDALEGCWGRVETEVLADAEGAEHVEVVVAEAWRIDLRSEGAFSIDAHSLTGLFGLPCSADDRPRVQSLEVAVLEVSDTETRLQAESGQSAGLDSDGSLSLHEVARAITFFATGENVVRFTVEGDNLVTSEASFDADEPSVDDVDLWVRFECVR